MTVMPPSFAPAPVRRAGLERFATYGVEPARRLNYWNSLVDQTFEGTYVNAPGPDFSAEMWRWSVGDMKMIRPRSQPAMVGRSPARGLDEERFVLHLQRRGASMHVQGHREAQLGPGDFVICSANRYYSIDLGTPHELLVVEFPAHELTERLPNVSDQLARRIPGASSSGRIFHDFLLSLWRQGDQSDTDPEWQLGVARVFYDLVALAMRGADCVDVKAGRAVRQRLLALVEARLGDPDLRTTTIADALNVSPRTVQNMFAAMGATPSGYILERRLARAADKLQFDTTASITAIAYDLGFNDSAYFSRCFRQRHGASPSAWRRRHDAEPQQLTALRAGPVGVRASASRMVLEASIEGGRRTV